MRVTANSIVLIACTALLSAQAQTGRIIGKVVTEGKTHRAIPGVKVRVEKSAFSAVTNLAGQYEMAQIPVGEQVLVFSAIGYGGDTVTVDVKDGTAVTCDAALKQGITELPGMKISGRLEGQTKAYNIQKTSENIKNVISADNIDRFPDQNSAEALQRVTGVSVARDQGEGRYVQVRGSQPAYTTVSINGVSIPAPEGDIRSVALDVVPTDVLSQIVVTKAVTPEMDGGAIGGSVNLETGKAGSENVALQSSAALGYNAITGSRENTVPPLNGQGSLNIGKRFGDNGVFGVMLGGSYLRTNRGSDNSEYSWDDGALEELELRDYTVIRDRLGVNGVFDLKPSDNFTIALSGLYNRFGDQEYRRGTTIAFADGDIQNDISSTSARFYSDSALDSDGDDETEPESPVVERELKDRYEVQDILALSLGSEIKLGSITLNPRFSYSFAQETEPDAFYSIFEMEVDTLSADWSDRNFPEFTSTTTINDASSYELDGIEIKDNVTNESNLEGALDIMVPLALGANPVEIKAGFKGRKRTKMRDDKYEEYGWDGDDVTMDMVADDYSNPEFLDESYPNSADNFQKPEKMKDHYRENGVGSGSYEAEDADGLVEDNWAADYEATENVSAGYLQGKLSVGRLSMLAGLRLEVTGCHYTGYNVDVQKAEELLEDVGSVSGAIKKVSGYKKTVEAMPMVHAKLSPVDNLNIRAAYTRTFARPDFYSLVPYALTNDDGDEVELGNSDLENTHAHSVDFLGEYFFESIGVLSGGFFLKSISDFIYNQARVVEDIDGNDTNEIEYIQPVNGGDALLFGFEAALEKQLSFLPSFLSGVGLGGNYTFAQSEADVKTEQGTTRTINLPGQSQHVFNAFVQYEKYGLSARFAANFNSDFIEEVGADKADDEHYDDHLQFDASVSYVLPMIENLVVFADFVNLTNEPLRYYSEDGEEKIPLQQEYYKWWSSFGLKYSF